ncbi:MAG TPA: histidine kinase [Flavobacteriales bacterium]|nr:histidine kinase [Flavobacteriales bacterium]
MRRLRIAVTVLAGLCICYGATAQSRTKELKVRSVVVQGERENKLLDQAETSGPDRVDEAFKLVEQALISSIDGNDAATEARCYGVLGELFAKEGQCDLAGEYFTKCAEVHPDGGAAVVLRARLSQARCLVETKRYMEAREALDLLKQRVDGKGSEGIIIAVNALTSRILEEIGRIGDANSLLQQNIDLSLKSGYVEGEVESRAQLGANLLDSDREKGLAEVNSAWAKTEDISDEKLQYKARSGIAKKLEEKGEYEEALDYRQQLEQQASKGTTADSLDVLSNRLDLANAQRYTNANGSAIGTFQTVLADISTDSNADPRYLDLRMLALKNLSETHLEVGNTAAAKRYLEEYMRTVEMADRERRQKLEANLGLFSSLNADVQRIRLLEKDREINQKRIDLLQAQDEARTAELFSRNAIIIALVLALGLLAGLLVFRARARRKEQLATRLIELRSLRAQMNPHFIFNALNALNHYIALHDERRANQYLTDLSGLMRKVLTYSELEFIDLEDEVELLQQYLRLEHDRFQDKFDYTFTVDPSLLNVGLRVPPMLVQPFIENAVWHGLRHKEGMGHLTVEVSNAKDLVSFSVVDDGIGRTKAGEIKRGTTNGATSKGIDNARNRIALVNDAYGSRITLHIDDALPDGSGTRVRFELPKTMTHGK